MSVRPGLFALCLVLAGCARNDAHQTQANATATPQAAAGQATAVPASIDASPKARTHGFASLADRGELIAYPGHVRREDGAYTWVRADLSEEHALHAIAGGHLRVTTPDGQLLDVRYDRHVEHPSGDWTWIGHLEGHEGEQTILTFGDKAAFGSIAQAGKLPLRLTVRDGVSWLVETDPRKVAAIVNAATRPQRPDYHIVRKDQLPHRSDGTHAAADTKAVGTGASITAAAATATTAASTVDLLVGYTPGFASANGSAALTRINYLVEVANAAYANSRVDARLRLVRAMPVTYTDDNSNETALEQMSGYESGGGEMTPAAAFNDLRAAREQYGADLVVLVRDFRDPQNEGCGIAWLLGGGLQGINATDGWDAFGYSVVSDGNDEGTDGKNYFCRDESLVHELGHNMGAAHDKAVAEGDDGTLDNPDDYGAYTYSFGYKAGSTTGNFYTVMAYGDTGQSAYRTFSTPLTTFCGGHACGTSSEDNARTLNKTVPVVTGFRAGATSGMRVRSDFNGDGRSDVLWRNVSDGANTIWLSANVVSRQIVTSVRDLRWNIAGTGDFDGDGAHDILWHQAGSGQNVIWRSGSNATPRAVTTVENLNWSIVGVGDFDGDGNSDVLWRNTANGANAVWKSGNYLTQQPISNVPTSWKIGGTGDFNADGRSDIVWRNVATGATSLWFSGSIANSQPLAAVTNQDWKIAGVGDFDADGKSDLIWRNSRTGANALWRSGNVATSQAVMGVANLQWSIASIADYNGDGRSDLLWRNTRTGANTIWTSANSATVQSMTGVAELSWVITP